MLFRSNNIAELQIGLKNTNKNLSDLTDRVDIHDNQISEMHDVQQTHATDIDTIFTQLEDMTNQIGWEILDGVYKNWKAGFRKDRTYNKYKFKTNFAEGDFDGYITARRRVTKSVNFNPEEGFIKFGNNYCITFVDSENTGTSSTPATVNFTIVLKTPDKTIVLGGVTAQKDSSGYIESSKVVVNKEVTLPSDLPKCTYVATEARWFNERMLLLAPSE